MSKRNDFKQSVGKLKTAIEKVRTRGRDTSSPGDSLLVVSAATTCDLFGVSQSALSKWKRQATFPKDSITTEGYDLKKVFSWYTAWKYGNRDLAQRRAKADTEEREEKALLKKMQREVMEGKLISREEVLSEFLQRIMVVKSGLQGLNRTLPPQLFNKDPREWGDIIKASTNQLLTRFSHRTGNLKQTAGKKSAQR